MADPAPLTPVQSSPQEAKIADPAPPTPVVQSSPQEAKSADPAPPTPVQSSPQEAKSADPAPSTPVQSSPQEAKSADPAPSTPVQSSPQEAKTADPAPLSPVQSSSQEAKIADPASPGPILSAANPVEPAAQQNEIIEQATLEPDNKEVPPPETIPEPQPVKADKAEEQPPAEPAKIEELKPEEKLLDQAAGDNAVVQNDSKKDTNWQQREVELLKKIDELEKVKNQRSEDGVKLELKVREEEIDLLKARVKNLETELQAALSKPGGGKNQEMIENIKQQHEELLSKARGMIFDKTKMVKNQELQIQALTTQVQSLKDINQITKDLLEIRNSEVKAMEERFEAMEARFKAEKERYGLVLQRAQTSTTINDDLRKEYETQLAIFKELREKYEHRVQALVAENAKLKELNLQLKGPGSG